MLEKVPGDKCLKVFHIVTDDRRSIVTITAITGLRAECRAWDSALSLGVGNLILITEVRIVNWSDRLVVVSKS